MQYLYGLNENYEDFAAGRVLYGRPGFTHFPVRLASEMLGRCLRYLDNGEAVNLYDPCCGGGYLLTVLGFLYARSISTITGSDCDGDALRLAERNLVLLTPAGLAKREQQLKEMYTQYHKDSHRQAAESAQKLAGLLHMRASVPQIRLFESDISSGDAPADMPYKADVVITDLPYGRLTRWQGEAVESEKDAAGVLLENILPMLQPASVVCLCSDKHDVFNKNPRFTRLEKHSVGKRKFEIFRLR